MPSLRVVVLIALLAILPTACLGIESQMPPPPVTPAPGTPAPSPVSVLTPAASSAPTVTSSATPGPGAVPTTTATPQSGAAPAIVLVRSGGLAGRIERWSLSGDGRVATARGTKQAATPGQVAALLSDIQSLGFFKFNDRYGMNTQCRDCYSYELTVTAGGQAKTVSWVGEAGDAPPALNQILDRFNKLVAPAP